MFSRAVRRLYTPRASGSTPSARRAATGSSATSRPSTRTRPLSGAISEYSMRSVVVLPAPLGPSRPVIWPSCATKPTSSTATTRALSLPLPGKVLRRCSAVIMGFGIRDWGFGKAGVGSGISGPWIRGLACQSRIPNPESPLSRPPPVETRERRRVRQLVQALCVQAFRIGGVQELREQPRHAAGADDVVALAAQHQHAAVGQGPGDLFGVGGR